MSRAEAASVVTLPCWDHCRPDPPRRTHPRRAPPDGAYSGS